jgi:hypothetical protein
MNAEIFAEWLRRQGQRIVRPLSGYWHGAGHRVLQAFPHHWTIEPSEMQISKLLRQNNGLALRYSAPITAARAMKSCHIVCEHPGSILSK